MSSISDILRVLSDENGFVIFKSTANGAENRGAMIRTKFNLSRKQYYTRMARLISTGLITKNNGAYFLTAFGRVVMPAVDGMEVAKEILSVNRYQRIIFAPAYVKETLEDSIKQLDQIVEFMQKPFGEQALIDNVEDNEIYFEIKKDEIDPKIIKAANLRHEQLLDILEFLKKKQKGRTF